MSFKTPTISVIPSDDQSSIAVPTRALPQYVTRISFTKAVSGGVDAEWGGFVGSIGTGMAVNQTGGNLVITSGTTARSETIIRSTLSWEGGIRMRVRSTLSQRIISNNFFAELVDVIGDGLSYTISSPTVLVVSIPSNPFDSSNVGQSMYLGGFSGTGTFLSGRYPIASVSGNDVTFTVSSFAAGSGTLSAFGWNYYQLVYNGTTATNAGFDTQRKGYASGATTATINTTAAPGHLAIITGNDLTSTFADQLVASVAGTIQQSVRATRAESVPDDFPLRMQIRVLNGPTNPATTTTWTIGLVSISNYANQDVIIQDVRPMSPSVGLPVEILRSSSIATTVSSGTITTVSTVGSQTPVIPTGSTINSAATTNATLIKNAAGTLWSIVVSNTNAATRYVKLYNLTTAPTVGTSVPVLTIPVPTNGVITISGGANGFRFTTGISLAITAAAADSDTSVVTAGDTKVLINYT